MKWSQLRQGDLIEHNGEIINQTQALKLIRSGEQKTEFKTVTPEFKDSIMKQAFRDYVELVDDKGNYSAPNNGEVIEIDISL
jgi:hypothetical protein